MDQTTYTSSLDLPDLPVASVIIHEDHHQVSLTILFDKGTSKTLVFKPHEWKTVRRLAWKIAYVFQLQPRKYNYSGYTCEWIGGFHQDKWQTEQHKDINYGK